MEFSIDNTSLKDYYCDLVGHLGEMSFKLRGTSSSVYTIRYLCLSSQLLVLSTYKNYAFPYSFT